MPAGPGRRPAGVTIGLLPAEKRERFLEKLRECGIIKDALRAIRADRARLRRWREADEVFDKAVIQAQHEGIMTLEDIAMARARKTSDVLLIFMLKGANPQKYNRPSYLATDPNAPLQVEILGGLPPTE